MKSAITNQTKGKQGIGPPDPKGAKSSIENVQGGTGRVRENKRYHLPKSQLSLFERLYQVKPIDPNEIAEVVISFDDFINNRSDYFIDRLYAYTMRDHIYKSIGIVIQINSIEELRQFDQSITFVLKGVKDNSSAYTLILNCTQELNLSKIEINSQNIELFSNFFKTLSERLSETSSDLLNNLKTLKLGNIKLNKSPFNLSLKDLAIRELKLLNIQGQFKLADFNKLQVFECEDLEAGSIVLEKCDSDLEELRTGKLNGVFQLPDALDNLQTFYTDDICCTIFTLPKSLKNLKTCVISSIKNSGPSIRQTYENTDLIIDFPKTLESLASLDLGPVRSSWCEIRLPALSPKLKVCRLGGGAFDNCFKFPKGSLCTVENLIIAKKDCPRSDRVDICRLLNSLDNLKTLTVENFEQFSLLKESNSFSKLKNLTVGITHFGSDLSCSFELYNKYENLETLILKVLMLDYPHTKDFKLKLADPYIQLNLNLKNLIIGDIRNGRTLSKTYISEKDKVTFKLLFDAPDRFTNITFKKIDHGIDLEFPSSLNNLTSLTLENIGAKSTIKLPPMPKLVGFQYEGDQRDFNDRLPLIYLKYKLMLLQGLPIKICGMILLTLLIWRTLL